MDADSAAERLQVIRTLMERSAIYRRALAPIMIFVGILGLVSSVLGAVIDISTPVSFLFYWSATSALALAGAYILVRRQALRDKEPFWSPPTKRVTQALIPGLFGGAVVAAILTFTPSAEELAWAVPVTWVLLYGCAIHAAGFFMPRGFKLLGWLFIMGGTSLTLSSLAVHAKMPYAVNHVIMGIFFGGLHLAYGIYVNLTESGQNRA